MNELEKRYNQKLEILNGMKEMFYKDKRSFKKYLQEQSLNQQAKLFAFFAVNDKEFYEEVNKYTGGIQIGGIA